MNDTFVAIAVTKHRTDRQQQDQAASHGAGGFSRMSRFAIAIACTLAMSSIHAETQQPARVTILYDAFGPRPGLQKDWGFAALVEYGGRRILFDTGNDASLFARNVKQLGVDLSRLDAAVISHRHGDHTTGLEVLVAANATVPIYAPQEGAFFRGGAPKEFLARDASLQRTKTRLEGECREASFDA